jgi:hypothetical protein
MSGATAAKSPSGVTVGTGVAVVLVLALVLGAGGCAGCRPHDGADARPSKRTPAAQTRATRDPDTVTRSTVAGCRTGVVTTPDSIDPDNKSWTWVSSRACPESRFEGVVYPAHRSRRSDS